MPWLGWHVFRRSTATFADQLGMGTSDRKGVLGHSTDAISRHYVRQAELDRRRSVLNQIAANLALEPNVTSNVFVMKKASRM